MMVITDLDGTIVGRDGSLTRKDRDALELLGARGIPRIAATGRSLHGTRKVLSPDFPLDYLIFSSGLGIVSWRTGASLRSHALTAREAEHVARLLIDRGVDFMLHDPLPENHRFLYLSTGQENPDFAGRLLRYADFSRPWDPGAPFAEASQFIVVDPTPHSAKLYEELRAELPAYSLVRATSPLDHRSTWIEIFPKGVAKAMAGAFLAAYLGIPKALILAVGNDYNDLDLLHWAGTAFVVADAPAEIRSLFPVVAPHDAGGFAEAVFRWLKD